MKKRLESLMLQYGGIAIAVYFVIFGAVLAGFFVAIRAGFAPATTAGEMGTFGAAYLATKATQPLRILATLALTPIIGRLVRRDVAPSREASS